MAYRTCRRMRVMGRDFDAHEPIAPDGIPGRSWAKLISMGRIVEVSDAPPVSRTVSPEASTPSRDRVAPKALGGGWYQVGNRRIRGREKALAAAEG